MQEGLQMSTEDSATEPTDEVVVPETPERPNGVTNEQWSEFMTKFDTFAERIEKGLTAKRPAAPKATTQPVSKPSPKPEPKTESAPEKTEEQPKKKKRGYWG